MDPILNKESLNNIIPLISALIVKYLAADAD
jgi:hypothetical protein